MTVSGVLHPFSLFDGHAFVARVFFLNEFPASEHMIIIRILIWLSLDKPTTNHIHLRLLDTNLDGLEVVRVRAFEF